MKRRNVEKAKTDRERLVAPHNLADFLRDSPFAEAVAAGEFRDFGGPPAHAPFARPRDMGRSLDLV